jgi:hypothetical protein
LQGQANGQGSRTRTVAARSASRDALSALGHRAVRPD